MKRLCSLLLILGLLLALNCGVYAADITNVFGDITQPLNLRRNPVSNFTGLYSPTVNAGTETVFPVSTFLNCVGVLVGESYVWRPSTVGNAYFNIRADGMMAPSDTYTAAVKWTAPDAGFYRVNAVFRGGSNSDGDGDGVIMSIVKNSEQLKVVNFSNTLTDNGAYQTLNSVYSFEKGESVFFITDPKTNGSYDNPWWTITVSSDEEELLPPDYSGLQPGESLRFGENTNLLDAPGWEGFTAVYSTSVNTNGNFDLSALNNCEKRIKDGSLYYWRPQDPAASWFRVRTDGLVAPDTGFTAGLKWVCPKDGSYDINIKSWGGTSDPGSAGDGVIFYVYKNSERLMYVDSGKTQTPFGNAHKISDTLPLKEGDTFYFLSDPKTSGGWDDPWWNINFTLEAPPLINPKAPAPTVTIGTELKFGAYANLLNVQGMQGFIAMASAQTSKGNAFPTQSFLECENRGDDIDPIWTPPLGMTKTVNYLPWFQILPTGYIGGDDGYSAAVKWICPADGKYGLTVSYSGGTQYDKENEANADGVIFGIYKGTEVLHSFDSQKQRFSGKGYEASFDLKAGDEFFFISDPKSTSAFDDPWWNITFKYLAGEGGGGNLGGQNDNAAPSDTKDNLNAFTLASIITAAALVVFSRKKIWREKF